MLKVNLCTFWLQFFIFALFCGHGPKTHNFCLMCFDASKLPFGLQTWFSLLCFVLRFCVLDLVLFYLIGMYSFVSLVWYVECKSFVHVYLYWTVCLTQFSLVGLSGQFVLVRFGFVTFVCSVWYIRFGLVGVFQ